MLKKYSISKRLKTAFFWISMLVATSGAIGFFVIEKISAHADIIFEEKYPIVQEAYNLSLSVNAELLAIHSHLLQETNALTLLEAWDQKSVQHLQNLDLWIKDPAQRQTLSRIHAVHEITERLTEQMIALSARQADQSQLMTIMKEMEGDIDTLMAETENLIQLSKGEMDQAMASADRFQQRSRIVLISVTVLAFLIAFQLGRRIAAGITRPLDALVSFSKQVADGDLSQEFNLAESEDEIGDLTKAFHTMISNLRENLDKIVSGTTVIFSSVSELSASSAQLASSSAENATSVNETTTTVEEVRQTAELASTKAEQMADETSRVRAASQRGRESTEQTVQGMTKIHSQMGAIAETIIRLSEQSQAIGQIIATVDSIAEQSNVLAVNASIEAAKAGEHGKGFSVVAQEVKSLAEQSKQATTEVRSILNEIQKATSSAVMATEQGSKVVEKGTETASQTGQAIVTLSESLEHSADAAVQIAAASQQQRVGMDQITAAMESVREASQQNATSAKQLEGAVHNLKTLGEQLKKITENYRL